VRGGIAGIGRPQGTSLARPVPGPWPSRPAPLRHPNRTDALPHAPDHPPPPPPQVTNLTSNGAPSGVRVVETGADEAARLLARAHAAVVSEFVKGGHQEAMRAHAVPAAQTAKKAGGSQR
jgi:hypothetical protein